MRTRQHGPFEERRMAAFQPGFSCQNPWIEHAARRHDDLSARWREAAINGARRPDAVDMKDIGRDPRDFRLHAGGKAIAQRSELLRYQRQRAPDLGILVRFAIAAA